MSRSRGGLARGRRAARSRGPARRAWLRPVKTTILIVGEGRVTEPNYFDALKRKEDVAARFSVTVKKGRGKSPEQVVDEAVRYRERAESREEDYDQVWCVLDVEGADKRAALDRAAVAAQQNGITLCLSNPCFEVWLLAHFERRAGAYSDCGEAIVRLNRYWRKHHRQEYEKDDDRIYERVSDRTRTAVDNAKWVREVHHAEHHNTADCNSSTDVYRLVRLMDVR